MKRMKQRNTRWWGMCLLAACAGAETVESSDLPPLGTAPTVGAPSEGMPRAVSGAVNQAPSAPAQASGDESAPGGQGMAGQGMAGVGGGAVPPRTPPQVDEPRAAADPTQPTAMPTPAGPADGDPNSPVVELPGLACGEHPSLLGLTAPNAEIGGRAVHVAYPCNKRQGAPVVFILNLHGTMPAEELKLYQVAYFSVNNLVSSHNFITVAPKSVVAQWGNGDGGVDEPHLMEVIDWVYTTFADFDIRSMWVAGHSWGAGYTARFGCKAELADKVGGLVLMSGGGSPPCASRVSAVITMAEGDGRRPADQSSVATAHGCDAGEMTTLLMNDVTIWPSCDPPFVHGNYYMRGKQHATYMDAEVVRSIGDLINSARP